MPIHVITQYSAKVFAFWRRFVYFATDATCPSVCVCHVKQTNGTTVDCSKRQLKAVPGILPANTVELLLQSNNIEELSDDAFRNCCKLTQLQISDNQLMRISPRGFQTVRNLQELFLNDNQLRYESLPKNLFCNLTKLSVLHLENNLWQNLTSYPQDMFAHLSNLTRLSLDAYPGAKFEHQFSTLHQLTNLRVYGGLDVVRNDTFAVFSNSSITELSLKTYFEPDAFQLFISSKHSTLDAMKTLVYRTCLMPGGAWRQPRWPHWCYRISSVAMITWITFRKNSSLIWIAHISGLCF